ncbi:MAG: Abi family protein [Treponema sp.]|nr:Abi family protein [Treponema sp.]
MYSLKDLSEHLNTKHNLPVQENQIQDLRNIGYYHGYKGYRFIRKAGNLINFTAFGQIVDLNNFDMQLKGLFYPNLMFIENALKSYVLEAISNECPDEKLNSVYIHALTHYKDNFQIGSNNYKKEFKKRMDLEMKINSALIRDYMQGKDFINHYYNQDREIPIWAAFESLTLGEFGTFYSCSGEKIRTEVSKTLKLPSNLDSDGFLLADIIFCLKDLRNAIAHNGIIFDTRFANAKIPDRVVKLIEQELKINNLNFDYIIAYIALVVYVLNNMGERKRCKSFINEFLTLHGILKNLPKDCKMKIEGTQEKLIVSALGNLLKVDFSKNLQYL